MRCPKCNGLITPATAWDRVREDTYLRCVMCGWYGRGDMEIPVKKRGRPAKEQPLQERVIDRLTSCPSLPTGMEVLGVLPDNRYIKIDDDLIPLMESAKITPEVVNAFLRMSLVKSGWM